MQTKTFKLMRQGKEVGQITLSGGMITGSEQNLVLLDSEDMAVLTVDLQPGVDRVEVSA